MGEKSKRKPVVSLGSDGRDAICAKSDSKDGRLFGVDFDFDFGFRFHKRVELGNGGVGDGFFDDGFDLQTVCVGTRRPEGRTD